MHRKLTYETVYDEIKRRITSGEWKHGDRLPTIDQISAELGVGVSSVREAIRILGKQNILAIQQGRGTYVKNDLSDSPSQKFDLLERASFQQLTEARLILEPELAAIAAEKASEEERLRLVQIADTMRVKVLKEQDFLKEDLEFHFLIAEMSKNQVLVHMIRMITDLLLDSRRKTMKWRAADEKAASYHYLIAQAIAQSNSGQARMLMKLHMEDLLTELGNDAPETER